MKKINTSISQHWIISIKFRGQNNQEEGKPREERAVKEGGPRLRRLIESNSLSPAGNHNNLKRVGGYLLKVHIDNSTMEGILKVISTQVLVLLTILKFYDIRRD